jgi:hypothetical protein
MRNEMELKFAKELRDVDKEIEKQLNIWFSK